MPDDVTEARPRRLNDPERVVVLGSGFAGFFAAHHIGRALKPHEASISIIADSDGLLYQPLLPNVASGSLNPRSIVVPLTSTLKNVHLVRGTATAVDVAARTVTVTDPVGGGRETVSYDRLVLTPGGVTRLFDIPGLSEYAIGFKTVPQALHIRDLVLQRLERADDEPDLEARRKLLTFIVVGAGYAGTELIAQMAEMSRRLTHEFSELQEDQLHWLLLDAASAVMPELGDELGLVALKVLQGRGVDVRLKTSVAKMDDKAVTLTDDTVLEGAIVIWCAGVVANPLMESTGLKTVKGRLVVDADLRVPDHPELYALGDCAAVPDLTGKPDENGTYPLCPPTAQHAMRQGKAVAHNVVADVRRKSRKDYRHHDLGLVVDLGGHEAVAKPLGIALRGRLAKLVTRGYHVFALPTVRRRLRVLTDWMLAGRVMDDVTLGIAGMPQLLARDEHDRGAIGGSGSSG